MARGINKVILVGNLGADPETRYTPSGTAITSIRIATSESWKDKTTGEQQERTEWHRIKFFGRLAEIAGEYLKKGSQVYVEGRLRTEEYEKDGVKRWSTDVIADEMQMLGSRGGGGAGGEGGGGGGASISAASADPRAGRSLVRRRRAMCQPPRMRSRMTIFRSDVPPSTTCRRQALWDISSYDATDLAERAVLRDWVQRCSAGRSLAQQLVVSRWPAR